MANLKNLLFLVLYCIVGAILNTYKSNLGIIFIIIGFIFLAWSIRYQGWTLEEWGFNFNKKALFSIIPAFFCLVYAIFTLGVPQTPKDLLINFMQTFACISEELVFRGYALIIIIRLFEKVPQKKLYAVLISSVLWALVHTQYQGNFFQLFLGAGIPLATITLLTRSIYFAIVVHLMLYGPFSMILGTLFYALLTFVNYKYVNKQPNSISSNNNCR